MRLTAIFLTTALCVVHSLACTCRSQGLYHEKYRSQFHFSPSSGWIGDPCGFVHYDNTYHMFWWGELTSNDLVHYSEQNLLALKGQAVDQGYFTGSAVSRRAFTWSLSKRRQKIVSINWLYNSEDIGVIS